jgi:hypothetical protein
MDRAIIRKLQEQFRVDTRILSVGLVSLRFLARLVLSGTNETTKPPVLSPGPRRARERRRAMKTLMKTHAAVIAALTPTASALAATGPREDTSGLYVWMFLGVCALIVVAQVVPAILLAVGAIKGVAEGIKERRGRRIEAN